MNRPSRLLFGAGATILVAACVTINVYFPEAAAREAADEFIQGVLQDQPAAQPSAPADDAGTGSGGNPLAAVTGRALGWLIPTAQAQDVNIDISSPEIRAIQDRMAARREDKLGTYFQAGAVGFTNDGLVAIRDRSAVGLAERNRLEQVVAAENRDRRAVYREIAVANGHPEWEERIRGIFAERWIAKAPQGWYYQNEAGEWVQK